VANDKQDRSCRQCERDRAAHGEAQDEPRRRIAPPTRRESVRSPHRYLPSFVTTPSTVSPAVSTTPVTVPSTSSTTGAVVWSTWSTTA
jgi:hypothetical protein